MQTDHTTIYWALGILGVILVSLFGMTLGLTVSKANKEDLKELDKKKADEAAWTVKCNTLHMAIGKDLGEIKAAAEYSREQTTELIKAVTRVETILERVSNK